jgi:uncharacterized protein YjbI with pentapeptide repeats
MEADKGLPTAANDRDWLEVARGALVDAAGHVATLWTTYILALLYFYVATAGVTHRDLFLESPIKLPFLSIELPLKGYFWFGPILAWVLHVYVLIHVRLLADKVNGFGADLMTAYPDAQEREHYLRRLPINLFVQQLAAARLSKSQVAKRLLRAILWLTLVALPLGLFVFFELRFLPYHDEPITWLQRLLVVGDLVVLFYFWPGIASSGKHPERPSSRRWFAYRLPPLSVCVVGVVAAITVFYTGVFPGEHLDLMYASACSDHCKRLIKQCSEGSDTKYYCYDVASSRLQLREGLSNNPAFPSIIQLPNFDAANTSVYDSDAKFEAVHATLSMAGRDLVGADLSGGNFRKVDFTDANLSGAQLANANLRDANLNRAHLDFAVLDDAEMPGANFRGASARLAQFQRATLSGADLSVGDFSFSTFDGAVMIGAQFIGSTLYGASLRGTNLAFAQFQGAYLLSGHFEGSFLGGATLDKAVLVGADLSNTFLHFSSINGARVLGAKVDSASLQFSIVKNVHGECLTKDECSQFDQDFKDKIWQIQYGLSDMSLALASPVFRAKLTSALSEATTPGPSPGPPQKTFVVDPSWYVAEKATELSGDRQSEYKNWLVDMVCNSASDETTVVMVTWGLAVGLTENRGQIGELSAPLLSPQCRGTLDLSPYDRSNVTKFISGLSKSSRRCKSEKYAHSSNASSSSECEIFNHQSK